MLDPVDQIASAKQSLENPKPLIQKSSEYFKQPEILHSLDYPNPQTLQSSENIKPNIPKGSNDTTPDTQKSSENPKQEPIQGADIFLDAANSLKSDSSDDKTYAADSEISDENLSKAVIDSEVVFQRAASIKLVSIGRSISDFDQSTPDPSSSFTNQPNLNQLLGQTKQNQENLHQSVVQPNPNNPSRKQTDSLPQPNHKLLNQPSIHSTQSNPNINLSSSNQPFNQSNSSSRPNTSQPNLIKPLNQSSLPPNQLIPESQAQPSNPTNPGRLEQRSTNQSNGEERSIKRSNDQRQVDFDRPAGSNKPARHRVKRKYENSSKGRIWFRKVNYSKNI